MFKRAHTLDEIRNEEKKSHHMESFETTLEVYDQLLLDITKNQVTFK